MSEWVAHSHPDRRHFRSIEEYGLTVPCSRCGALPGGRCWRKHNSPRNGQHVAREKVASTRQRQDQNAAPHHSEWADGVCYSTLPGCQP